MALLSWSLPFHPPLPLVGNPPAYPETPQKSDYSFGKDHPVLGSKGDLDANANAARDTLAKHHDETEMNSDNAGAGQSVKGKVAEMFDKTNSDEARRVNDQFSDASNVTQHLSELYSPPDHPLSRADGMSQTRVLRSLERTMIRLQMLEYSGPLYCTVLTTPSQ